jgi:hypothetical protein
LFKKLYTLEFKLLALLQLKDVHKSLKNILEYLRELLLNIYIGEVAEVAVSLAQVL